MSDATPDRVARLDTPSRPAAAAAPSRRLPARWRWRNLRRLGWSAVLAIGTALTAFVMTPVMPAAAAAPSPQNVPAHAAVIQLTGPHPAAVAVPANFAVEAGYEPTLQDGLLVDPLGSCSSPIQLPTAFMSACRAHDLGYDVLRYAQRRHQPLGPWARQAIDAAFQQHMQDACDRDRDTVDRAHCDVMATVAATAVDLNSRRQNYATPEPEYLFGTELSGKHIDHQLVHALWPVAAGVGALGAVFIGLRVRRRVNRAGRPA